MSYHTIVVHVDASPQAPARIDLAARLARTVGAHLCGAAFTGVSRYAGSITASWPQLAPACEQLRQQAVASLAAFDQIAAAADVPAFSIRLLDDDAENGLVLQARYADLVVLSQADPGQRQPAMIHQLPPSVLLHGGRPLLLAPLNDESGGGTPARRPLLGWDGSRSAMRAISDALPLLRRAGTTTLCVLNPGQEQPGVHGAEAGADMALYLARHGVEVEVLREFTTVATGDALLAIAAERQCDLLVMGGYGHQRAQQTLLGGATRAVLEHMTLPVLISH